MGQISNKRPLKYATQCIFIILLFLCTSFQCGENFTPHYVNDEFFTIVNESDDDVYLFNYYLNDISTLSDLDERPEIPKRINDFKTVKSNESIKIKLNGCDFNHFTEIEKFEFEFDFIYIYKKETLAKYTLNELYKNEIYDRQIAISVKSLTDNNFVVTYR